MKLRLRARDAHNETELYLHDDYSFSDLVQAIDHALLQGKRLAVTNYHEEEIRLDLRRYSALALTSED